MLMADDTACSPARGPVPVRAEAQIVDKAVCSMPDDAQSLGVVPPFELLPVSGAQSGAVPAGFSPVAAITCGDGLSSIVDAELTASFTERRWEGDLSTAVSRLNAPSEGPRLDQNTCPVASSAPIPDLWLIDAGGSAVRPSYPVDECGFRQIGGLNEVEALTEVGRVDHRVQLTDSMVHQRMGCGSTQVIPKVGSERLVTDRFFVRNAVCRFTITVDGIASFMGAEELGEGLDELFTTAMPAGLCSSEATRTANTSVEVSGSGTYQALPVLIEVDGCRRILIDNHVPLLASDALISLVS